MVILIPLWCIYQCWFIKSGYDDNEEESDDEIDENEKPQVNNSRRSSNSSWGLPVRKKRFVYTCKTMTHYLSLFL